jgi:sugar-specific transcriptional regulator TrmB
MIVDKLQQIGLSQKEAQLYWTALSLGTVKVSELASRAQVNRTTAYQILEELVKKGLAVWEISERGRRIKINPPQALGDYLENRQKEVDQAKYLAKDLIPTLSLKFAPEEVETKILYHRGERGINEMLWQMLLQVKDNSYLLGYADLSWTDIGGEGFIKKLRKVCIKRKIKDCLITAESQSVKEWVKKEKERIKELGFSQSPVVLKTVPANRLVIKTDYYITDNEVCYFTFDKNKKPIGIRIINKLIAQTEKAIFNMIWQTAKPVKI